MLFPKDALALFDLDEVPPDLATLAAITEKKIRCAVTEANTLELAAAEKHLAQWLMYIHGADSSAPDAVKNQYFTFDSGIQYEPLDPKPVVEHKLIAAFYQDSQTEVNCRPIGQPDWEGLTSETALTLLLAQNGILAGADMLAVKGGDAAAARFVEQGFRVEMKPMGSASLGQVCPWDVRTSWPLGEQVQHMRGN